MVTPRGPYPINTVALAYLGLLRTFGSENKPIRDVIHDNLAARRMTTFEDLRCQRVLNPLLDDPL